ncbi:hypothetical protein HDU98_006344 [Podochytrium sp. JEL0797]|nr:hypothetical protein HDU98_006344 [Podochytrium sp. JEL0797]
MDTLPNELLAHIYKLIPLKKTVQLPPSKTYPSYWATTTAGKGPGSQPYALAGNRSRLGVRVARGLKAVIREDFFTGCSESLQPAHLTEHSQMGVLLVNDEFASPYGSFPFLTAAFPSPDNVLRASVPIKDAKKSEPRFELCGFRNSVALRRGDSASDNLGLEALSVSEAPAESLHQPKSNEDHVLGLEWDLLMFVDEKNMAAVLKKVEIPIIALLEGFIKYRPGLADLDTEDEDSEWMSEDSGSAFGENFGDGFYDEDQFYYDEEDSGGFASDYDY